MYLWKSSLKGKINNQINVKKENFHNKTEHKYQNKEKRKWGVLTLHRQD